MTVFFKVITQCWEKGHIIIYVLRRYEEERGRGVNQRSQGQSWIHFHPGKEIWLVDEVTSRLRWLGTFW